MSEKRREEWDKIDRLRFVLDHWQDIFSPSVTSTWATISGGIPGGKQASKAPSPLPQMSHHISVRQIQRALTILADREPVLCRHLKAARCNAEWRTTNMPTVVTLPSGKRDVEMRRVRQKIVLPWVRDTAVAAAELRLLKLIPGDVSIPTPLYHALWKTSCNCKECRRP